MKYRIKATMAAIKWWPKYFIHSIKLSVSKTYRQHYSEIVRDPSRVDELI